MKRYLKGLLNLFICGIIIVLLLFPISELLEPKRVTMGNENQYIVTKGFYNEKNDSLDILFLGDSIVYRSISPMELWDEYGITSYVYGSPNQKIFISYYMLKDALEYQTPSLVVLNVESLFDTKKIKSGSVAKAFDDMENLSIKMKVLFDNNLETPIVERFSYIFKVFRYHYRYKELSSDDIKYFYNRKVHNSFKGYEPISDIKKVKTNDFSYMNRNLPLDYDENCYDYLLKIVDLCNENNIKLVLIESPSYKNWTNERSSKVKELAKELNVDFYDLNINQLKIDWNNDSMDYGYHLNTNGAIKTTKYLGNLFTKNYDFKNHKNDSYYEQWNIDSKIYNDFIENK